MIEKLRKFARFLNEKGIALPLLRDPRTGVSSITLTMMVVSFLFCLMGLLQKLNSTDLDVDMSQALTLLGITSTLYLGRKLSTDDNSTNSSDDSSQIAPEDTKKDS